MPTKTIKKAVKKVTKKVTPKQEELEYHLTLKFNGFVYEFDTNDVIADLLSVKPEFLRTNVVVQATKGTKLFDKLYFLHQGKKLFYDKIVQETLLRNIKQATHECI